MGQGGGGASRSTESARGTSEATDVSLREHWGALRDADLRFDAERDRRLTEVAIEREKALKIKETADLAALGLAREIQTYKDEKANELREQIGSERGRYLTRDEYLTAHVALIDKVESGFKPLNEYMTAQQGRTAGIGVSTGVLIACLSSLGVIVGIVVVLANLLTGA